MIHLPDNSAVSFRMSLLDTIINERSLFILKQISIMFNALWGMHTSREDFIGAVWFDQKI